MRALRSRLRPQVFFLCAGVAAALALIPTHNFARADDLLTPAVKGALVDQWNTPDGAEVCIRALEAYGNSENAKEALKVLKTDRSQGVQQTYDIASDVLGTEFWRLVAASHPPASAANCTSAETAILAQFGTSRKSLYDSAKAYRAKRIYVAVAELLRGADATTRPTYRGCFDLSPPLLFRAVEKTIGFRQ